jgi:hypothetical protein
MISSNEICERAGRISHLKVVALMTVTARSRLQWFLFALYLALFGSFCGLELDTFVSDLPFFQFSTFLLFLNVLSAMLVPVLVYAFFSSIRPLWKHRSVRVFILILNAIYLHIIALLAIYKSNRHIDFDFNFLRYNTGDVLPVLWKLYAPWLFVIVLTMTGFVFLQKPAFAPVMEFLKQSPRKTRIALLTVFAASITCQFCTLRNIRGSTAGFVYANFLSDHRLRNDYHEFYRQNIDSLRTEVPRIIAGAHPQILGDAIFFVKQESLNGLLVGPRITPQLLRISQDGILFPDFYANSIQSIRGYECILCGVPPNVTGALVDDYTPAELKDLNCLPRLFRSFGYHSLYFFAGSRNPRIMRFAQSIGFEKVLADEIMQPDDVKFDWGYREDVFFNRVFEYLRQYSPSEKLFIFIDTGATNHTPFQVHDDRLLPQVPFPHAKKFEERLSNTTFVQDAYLGYFYDLFKKNYSPRSSLVVASDHSWPIPIHKNNIFNERGAYEENFRIPMLFVPPAFERKKFAVDTAVTRRFSQMDIFPTILNLIGLEQRHLLGESFEPWLLLADSARRSDPLRPKLSVQPYGGGYISIVQYPEKYLFDLFGKNYTTFDLEKDPRESSPSIQAGGENSPIIRDFFYPEATKLAKNSHRFH